MLIFSGVSENSHGFRASLFHPSFGNEVVEGRIFVDRWKLRFASATVNQEIPADRLEAEWEEGEARICFKDSQNSDLNIFTLDRTILTPAVLPQLEALRTQIGELNGQREFFRRSRITLYFLAGCVLIAWALSWATGAMVRSIATKVPPEWEQSIGAASIKRLEAETSLGDYSNQVAQLSVLATPLLKVLPNRGQEVKFYIVNDPEPNAFALPGNFVVVNSGLLALADRPEEIQGVLAHELAHVTEKHLVRKLVAASGPILIFGLFLHSDDGLMNLLIGGSGLAVFQGFSKEFETEADDVGWNYLLAANIDPRGMLGMFQKFQMREKVQQKNHQAGLRLPQALSSHPRLEQRINRLESKWKKLHRKDGFIVQTNSIPAVASN